MQAARWKSYSGRVCPNIAGRGTGRKHAPGWGGCRLAAGSARALADLARPAAGPEGIAGSAEKIPWPFWWNSSTVFVPGTKETAMASGGTATGMTDQRPGVPGDELGRAGWVWRLEGQVLSSNSVQGVLRRSGRLGGGVWVLGIGDPVPRQSGVELQIPVWRASR
jgi:hypothetical protein